MKTTKVLWIDHGKNVIVTVTDNREEVKKSFHMWKNNSADLRVSDQQLPMKSANLMLDEPPLIVRMRGLAGFMDDSLVIL